MAFAFWYKQFLDTTSILHIRRQRCEDEEQEKDKKSFSLATLLQVNSQNYKQVSSVCSRKNYWRISSSKMYRPRPNAYGNRMRNWPRCLCYVILSNCWSLGSNKSQEKSYSFRCLRSGGSIWSNRSCIWCGRCWRRSCWNRRALQQMSWGRISTEWSF